MTDNIASVIGDRNEMLNSFDYFDQFIKSKSESDEEIVEEFIEEVIEEVDDSSSSYYEEEIIDDPLARTSIRLDTLHEKEEEEDYSESDALWEDVSESFHCESDVSRSFNSGKASSKKSPIEELKNNSDMLARVRELINSNKLDEGSMVESESDSDGGGSSSVLPLDFDMGSDDDDEPDSSDEEEDEPEDYEQACREMIATVHPNLDPKTMLHGCDVQNLYTNLRHQYRHMVRTSKKDLLKSESMESEPAIIEDDDPDEDLDDAPGDESDDGFDEDPSASDFVELSFKSNSERHPDIVSPEPVVNNLKVEDTNKSSVAEQFSYVSQVDNYVSSKQIAAKEPPKIEKWFHRNNDDPEDFEYACRLLCAYMYDPNDPDYDIDTMLQRSTSPQALYRYLKPNYWYLAHSNQLDEHGYYISNESPEEEEQLEDAKKEVAAEEQASSNKVEALRSFFANRNQLSEGSKMSGGSKRSEGSRTLLEQNNSESAIKDIEMHEEKTSDQFDEPVLMDVNESTEDACEDSQNDEMEAEDENVAMEVSSLGDDQSETSYISDDSEERSEDSYSQNSMDDSNSYSSSENDNISVDTFSERFYEDEARDKPGDRVDDIADSEKEKSAENDQDDSTWQEEVDIKNDDSNDFEEPAQEDLIHNDLNDSIVNSSTEKDSSEHALVDKIDMNEPSSDVPTDDLDESSHPAEETPISNNLHEAPEGKESSNHSMGEEVDTNEPCSNIPTDDVDESSDPAEEASISNNLHEAPEEKEGSEDALGEEVEIKEPCSDVNETNGPEEEISLSNNMNETLEAKENSMHSVEEGDDMDEPHSDELTGDMDEVNGKTEETLILSTGTTTVDANEIFEDQVCDQSDDNEEPIPENNLQNSWNENTERSSEDKENPVSIEIEKVDANDLGTDRILDSLGETKELEPENDIHNSPEDRNEGSLDHWRDEIDESMNESCGSLLEQYSREYNDIVSRRKNEDTDENRLRLLELSVKYIRGERLADDEIQAVEEFFDQEAKLAEENEVDKERDSTNDSNSGAVRLSDYVESKQGSDKVSGGEICSSIGDGHSNISYDPLQDTSSQHKSRNGRRIAIDVRELEWRKTKIQEDLKSIIKETEESELRQPLSPEIIAALKAASLRTALTKKYYDTMQRDYIYYPSVAKSLKSFSLIDEAERVFRNEFSFELSTALCTVAAYRMKGRDEVNENDSFIKKATVDVILDEILNQSTISFSSFGTNGGKSKLSEKKVRKIRIQNDLERIIKDAKKDDIGCKIDDEAIDALTRAANEIVFIKKYYDVDTDMFKYFPSVKNTILNRSLMDRAEDFYFDGVQDFPLDYTSALRASASRFLPDFVEVDELDTYVINMAVDVDVDDEPEDNQLEKGRDFSMTNDTASMMSSQTTEALVNEEYSSNKTDEQKVRNDTIESEDVKTVASQPENDRGTSELDEKTSFLNQRYLDDMRKIDEALFDLETEFVSELNRLDNETKECSLKHKIEAERLEKDRRGIEEKAHVDENNTTEQKKVLREKLKNTVATLESERNDANKDTDMDTDEGETDESRGWGWFNNKPKQSLDKEKQKQERLMKFKLREVELEKEISDIKTQLDFVRKQAKEQKRNISEWKAELDEEYRQLENLTSATEEKLKEEKCHLQASYEEEKQRLLSEKKDLQEIRNEDETWLASEKKKIQKVSESNSQQQTQKRSNHSSSTHITSKSTVTKSEELIEIDSDDYETDDESEGDEDDSIRSNTIGSSEDIPVEERSTEMDGHSIPLNDTTSNGDDVVADKDGDEAIVPDHLAVLNQPKESNDEGSLGSNDLFDLPEGEDVSSRDVSTSHSRRKSGEGTETIKEDSPVVPDHLAVLNQPKESNDEASLGSNDLFDVPEGEDVSSRDVSTSHSRRKSGKDVETVKEDVAVVPDHLAVLNQPKESNEEGSLGSNDLFDVPEGDNVSTIDMPTSSQKGKPEENLDTKPPKQEIPAVSVEIASTDPPKQHRRNSAHKPPMAPPTPKVQDVSNKKFLTAALKGKQNSDATPSTEEKVLQTPRKSLREMRRKVDEALEKAIAIRNGDSSSRHSRSVAVENESERSGYRSIYSPAPRTPSQRFLSPAASRRSLNPMYPMIREADRLSGFIRRYEKKLESACKSLLTLASVSGDDKDVLAARELELPEMLEFVTNQDWYKEHSTETNSAAPHLLFSRGKKETEVVASVGNSDNRYSITATGKSFLEIDGPTPSDVSRFLTYLKKIEDGLTKDAMQAQWKEIANLSGDEQSQRVCDKLDQLISFCMESKMIKT